MHTSTVLVPTDTKCTPIISFWNLYQFTTCSDSKCTPVICTNMLLVLTDSKCTPIIYTITLLVPTDSKCKPVISFSTNTLLVLTVNAHQSCINTLLVLTDSTCTPIICSSKLLVLTDSTCTPNRFNSPFTQPRVEISTLATDKHPSIRKTLADNYDLCHSLWQFDVWQVQKSDISFSCK